MNKVIIKTAIITFLTLVVAFILGVIGIYAFAPRIAGKYCYELGFKNMATECNERVYTKTGEFSDLVELVDSAIYAENYDLISTYGEEMVKRTSDFKSFCESEVDEDYTEDSYSTFDYYVNTTMLAKYSLGNVQNAIDFAFDSMSSKGYTENSSLKMLVNMIESQDGLGQMICDTYNNIPYDKGNKFFIGHENFRTDMKNLGYPVN